MRQASCQRGTPAPPVLKFLSHPVWQDTPKRCPKTMGSGRRRIILGIWGRRDFRKCWGSSKIQNKKNKAHDDSQNAVGREASRGTHVNNRPGERDHGEGTEPGAAPRDDEREHGTLLLLWLPRVLPFATWRRVVLRSRRPAGYRGVLLLGDRGAGARHSGLSPGLPPPAALRHRRPGRPAAHVRLHLLSGEPLLLLAFMAATHTKTKSDRPTKPTEFFLLPPPAPPLISLPRATLKTPTYSSRRTTRTCFAGPTRAWHKTTERSRRRRCEGRKGNGAGGERERAKGRRRRTYPPLVWCNPLPCHIFFGKLLSGRTGATVHRLPPGDRRSSPSTPPSDLAISARTRSTTRSA